MINACLTLKYRIEDFGEVQEIEDNYIKVQKRMINKENFYIPKDQAESYDGNVLKFRLSESELKTRYKDEPFMKDAESNTLESYLNELEEDIDSQKEVRLILVFIKLKSHYKYNNNAIRT
jgi:hypothetical protein